MSAREQSTGVEASIAVKPSYGLSDDEIARMLQDSFAHATDDMHARALAEDRVEAERMLDATRAALAGRRRPADAARSAAIDAALAELAKRLDGERPPRDHAAIDALNRATDEFAARRMDAASAARSPAARSEAC